MNKKTNRSNLRGPTAKPAASIVPSATLALDGELPLAASHGVSAPEPLAAHDVLHAAMAPLDGAAADATAPVADGVAVEPAIDTPAEVAATPAASAKPKRDTKKPAKSVTVDAPAVPAKAAKAVKDKFVKVTFALPESEAGLLDAMKKTHQGNGVALKKGQLLRAGLLALADLDSAHIAKLVAHLPAAPVATKKKKSSTK
ncbi:hypothetical protein [Massilia sp. S19_KUP03_FR1]|uniref:hypothetical protein n=1 Tax=Massilia sp. S19_KUP03_FR1 TaxID=3025503 RepID=UPI002FCDA192